MNGSTTINERLSILDFVIKLSLIVSGQKKIFKI